MIVDRNPRKIRGNCPRSWLPSGGSHQQSPQPRRQRAGGGGTDPSGRISGPRISGPRHRGCFRLTDDLARWAGCRGAPDRGERHRALLRVTRDRRSAAGARRPWPRRVRDGHADRATGRPVPGHRSGQPRHGPLGEAPGPVLDRPDGRRRGGADGPARTAGSARSPRPSSSCTARPTT
jgi:hypothetical protein